MVSPVAGSCSSFSYLYSRRSTCQKKVSIVSHRQDGRIRWRSLCSSPYEGLWMVPFIEQTYFEVSNTPDMPTQAEINFLHPPVLQKHNAPGNRDDSIEIRAATPKGPSKDTSCCWKNQGHHVGLQETKIKANLSNNQHSTKTEDVSLEPSLHIQSGCGRGHPYSG